MGGRKLNPWLSPLEGCPLHTCIKSFWEELYLIKPLQFWDLSLIALNTTLANSLGTRTRAAKHNNNNNETTLKPVPPVSPALASGFITSVLPGKPSGGGYLGLQSWKILWSKDEASDKYFVFPDSSGRFLDEEVGRRNASDIFWCFLVTLSKD